MSALQQGYLVGVSGCVIAAAALPLVWWKPSIFGPLLLWLVLVTFVIGDIMMTLT
jgi:predicted MFS family arabinose efflux permease